MLFMVIERFRNGNAKAVYERFLDKGRLMPDSLTYKGSWVTVDSRLCYQLVECEDEALVEEWTREWDDLIQFTVHPVVSGIDAAKDQDIDFSDIPELDDDVQESATNENLKRLRSKSRDL